MGEQRVALIHSPTAWFIAYLFVSLLSGMAARQNASMNVELIVRLEGVALGFIAAVWVRRDTTKKRGHFPEDLMFLFWFALFPIYLITEKKTRGFLMLIAILLTIFASLVAPEFIR